MQSSLPDIPEYSREDLLGFEKEVLGLYVSGHPLEADEERLRRNVTARLADFTVDEETGEAGVVDGATVTVGGLVHSCSFKNTKNGRSMCIMSLEDMSDTVDVMLFPKECETYRTWLTEGQRVFVRGRVSLGDDAKGKLICEQLLAFDELEQELYLLFDNLDSYLAEERTVLKLLAGAPCVIALRAERQTKRLAGVAGMKLTDQIAEELRSRYGSERVAMQEKKVDALWKSRYNSPSRS